MSDKNTVLPPTRPAGSGVALFVRLGWMIGGVMAIIMASLSIAAHPTWSFGWRDAWFWAAVATTLTLRAIDIKRYQGDTADGRPATMQDFRRFATALVLSSAAAWTIVHSVYL